MDEFEKFNLDNLKPTKKDSNYNSNDYDNVVSVGHWILLLLGISLAAALPVVGAIIALIILLILSFADVNQNFKNYARANLIIIFISALLLLIVNRTLFFEIIKYIFS